MRNRWGQVLRSNLDWDWDLSSSLKRLFKIDTPLQGKLSLTGNNLDVSIATRCDGPPKEIRVAYKTETGETTYQTYILPGNAEPEQPMSYSPGHAEQGVGVEGDTDDDTLPCDDHRTRRAKQKVESWLKVTTT